MGYVGVKPSAVPLTSADITDGIITSAKIADGTIVNADINASAAIVSTKLSGSFGITEADHWRITTNFSPNSSSQTVLSTNWERADGTGNGYFGTGMTQSSGVFTFPSTGYYLIDFTSCATCTTSSYVTTGIQATTNNSTYTEIALMNSYITGGNVQGGCATSQIIDVTDTANVKIRFITWFSQSSGSEVYGSSTLTFTGASFIRLGDT
jgi:hypothetical protein